MPAPMRRLRQAEDDSLPRKPLPLQRCEDQASVLDATPHLHRRVTGTAERHEIPVRVVSIVPVAMMDVVPALHRAAELAAMAGARDHAMPDLARDCAIPLVRRHPRVPSS